MDLDSEPRSLRIFTNGQAEKAVQTIKNFLKKVPEPEWEDRLDSFLLGHNSTPSEKYGVSPAEFNLGRKPLTLLDKLRPDAAALKRESNRDRKMIEALQAKPLKPLQQEQPVVIRSYRNPKQKWEPGIVRQELGPRRVLVDTPMGLAERHTDQVKRIVNNNPPGSLVLNPGPDPPDEIPEDQPPAEEPPVVLEPEPPQPLPPESPLKPPPSPLRSPLRPLPVLKAKSPDPPVSVTPSRPRREQKLPAYLKDFVMTKKK
ncbi:uncharacterized protein LOC132196171 [Neocloeon triangulifer]|uniref:uncharacterized protein LOC132196171 n=1 Tax=Neocloeon triangulifer TaxID=2078957 RepID=UPI00286F8558|nr:uncharacterized protein LOC132196171 [Neocloeon triangulifer]